ncbi:sulfate transporter CysZ [Methylobacter sp. S3L5C]|uniref:sulfate transporter CysZ n=1 Tax=Methylobacter sp. S3L5C TaxID=2839024 RepID=UPI001FAC8AB3|nr:sulfate transporter CysZ [Methylobacter sp. S3L5C]UOA09264.1 sulfate transporter CysZ [Methylobacter sp. S3L5C]
MLFDKKGNNPALAVGYLFKGLKLLTSSQLRTFILIPVLINVVLYSVALTLGYYYIADLINQFIPGWLQWLSWFLWPLFFISFFIAGFFTFTVLANLLAAPFYGKLSAKTLALITGQVIATDEQPLIKVILAEVKRAGYLLSRALPLVIVSFIPGLNVIAPFLWVLFGAWGMALEYMAYPLENAGVLFSDQKQLVKSIRLGALSFGGIAAMGLTIPLLNIIVAPAAVIGATIYFNEIKKQD